MPSHEQKNTWEKRWVHISPWDLRRQYKVCNFVLTAETRWPLKRRGRPTGPSSKPVGSPVCVLQPSHYFTKGVPATKERYVQTLSVCIPTSHKRCRRRIKSLLLYFYVSTSFSCLSSGPIYDTKLYIYKRRNKYFFSKTELCHVYSTFRFITFGWRSTFFLSIHLISTSFNFFLSWPNACLHFYILICPQLKNKIHPHLRLNINTFSLARINTLKRRFIFIHMK